MLRLNLLAIFCVIYILDLTKNFRCARTSFQMNCFGITLPLKKMKTSGRSHLSSSRRTVNMAEQETAFLRFLLQANAKQAKSLLEQSTNGQLQALGEVCYNILHGDLDPERINKA